MGDGVSALIDFINSFVVCLFRKTATSIGQRQLRPVTQNNFLSYASNRANYALRNLFSKEYNFDFLG